MKGLELSPPQFLFVAGIRALLAAGAGLPLAERLRGDNRRLGVDSGRARSLDDSAGGDLRAKGFERETEKVIA